MARLSKSHVMLWIAVAGILTVSAKMAWRLSESVALARGSEPLQNSPTKPRTRLLIVGDSTAVGTGASDPQASLAGLLVQDFPAMLIVNRARDGAQFADVLSQMEGVETFDMVLVMAGGNDVIRMRGLKELRDDVSRVTQRARELADYVVLMPAGNVGNAPFFFAPLSWMMEWRSRKLHAAVREAAGKYAAVYVNLFHEHSDDPFILRPELNASDGLHPSDAGYQEWFRELLKQTHLKIL